MIIDKKEKEVYGILIRYLLVILASFSNLFIFYFVFTPLTIYPVYFITNLFYSASLFNSVLSFGNYEIWLIKACIAGSAYYFLFILNLLIPNIKIKKRIKMILASFAILLFINIFRIIFLIFSLDSFWFDFTHKLFWNLLSTVFVIGIWFLEVKIFKIKEIPFYTDLKNLYKKSLLRK